MSEEHFNQALPVLRGAFFVGVASVAFFCPWRVPAGGGAFGRGPVRATPATPVCGLLRRAGVARRRQKPCVVARGELSSPPFLWRSKERGRGGGGGAKPPRRGVGDPAFCVTIPQEGKAPYSCMRARLMRGLSFGIRGCFGQSRSTLASHPSNCRVPPLIAVPRPPNPASRFRSSALRFYPTSLRFIKPRLAF